jgi:integrase
MKDTKRRDLHPKSQILETRAVTQNSPVNLIDSRIAGLKPPQNGYTMTWDAATKGLAVRVTSNGVKSFVLDYRVKGTGQRRRMTLEQFEFGVYGIAEAQRDAGIERKKIKDGKDPLTMKRLEAQAWTERPTLKDLKERFIAKHVELYVESPQTQDYYKKLLKLHVSNPDFLAMALADVKPSHVNTFVLEPLAAARKKVTHNRVRVVISGLFKFAIKQGLIDTSPFNANINDPLPEKARDRELSDDELARLWNALQTSQSQRAIDAIKLLVYCGSRRGETFAARWDEFDLVNRVWVKPASNTKSGDEKKIPLNDYALAHLLDMRSRRTGSEFLFPGNPGSTGHLCDIGNAWKTILAAAGIARGGAKGFRLHDLRHTFASRLRKAKAPVAEIGALLDHSRQSTTTTLRYAGGNIDTQREISNLLVLPGFGPWSNQTEAE